MNNLRRVLLYYSTLLTGFIIVTGVISANSPMRLAMNLLFVPIGVFLLNQVIKDVKTLLRKEKEEELSVPLLGQKSFLVSAALLFMLLIGISLSGIGLAPDESASVASTEPASNPIIISNKVEGVESTPEPTPPKKLVIDSEFGFVNIRSSPTTSSEIVRKALNEEEYEYTGVESGWYQLLLKDKQIGWVLGRYIQEVSQE